MISPGIPLLKTLLLFTNSEGLWTLSLGVFTEVSLQSQDWLNHWILAIDSPSSTSPLLGWGLRVWYWKFQPSDHQSGSPSNQPPSLGLPSGMYRMHAKLLQLSPTFWHPMDCSLPISSVHGISRQETQVGYHALLRGIFPTQGLNPHHLCLLHWQAGSLPLVPLGSPKLA